MERSNYYEQPTGFFNKLGKLTGDIWARTIGVLGGAAVGEAVGTFAGQALGTIAGVSGAASGGATVGLVAGGIGGWNLGKRVIQKIYS